jgi:hypothetical protein
MKKYNKEYYVKNKERIKQRRKAKQEAAKTQPAP